MMMRTVIIRPDLMRTIIDVPPEDLQALTAVCERDHLSRAECIRRAIRTYVSSQTPSASNEAFGLWKQQATDGVDYQRALREEW